MAKRGDYKSFIGQPKKGKAVGFCLNKSHYGMLSLRNMKNHRCLAKNCIWFLPFKQHPYWQEREKKLSEKKSKKLIKRVEELIRNGTAEEIADAIGEIIEKGFE